jgi:hypothetical protein
MVVMPVIRVLAATRPENMARYQQHFAQRSDFQLRLSTSTADTLVALADGSQHTDVLVLDSSLENGFGLVSQLRYTYPRLVIVQVDEEADFAIPGQADDISTDPFANDDLIRRIQRLVSDRQLETLRADAMPPVRELSRLLRKATGEIGKQQAAVSACRAMGYDYVALYKLEGDPKQLSLKAQDGKPELHQALPRQAGENDIMTWVAEAGQSRIINANDTLSHPFLRKGVFPALVCVPIGVTNRYGVMVACSAIANSISQQNVLMLELISTQLAAMITRES